MRKRLFRVDNVVKRILGGIVYCIGFVCGFVKGIFNGIKELKNH